MNKESDSLSKQLSQPFQRSAETEALAKVLGVLQEGEKIAYSRIRDIIHIDPQTNRGRSITLSARNIALKEHGVVTACESRIGFIRVPNNKIAQRVPSYRARIGKLAKNAAKDLSVVEPTRLDKDEQSEYLKESSWVGAIALFNRPKVIAEIEQRVISNSSKVDAGDVLRLCGGK